ncbi:uncharacterized protein OCT59_026456 [Rhizophagus irregularis]|uniref:uncharacterized protein n=1 Tax=Rhizophagus irregularis TaxID=588596 RepID=UPI0033226B71|nr:hypothetical protein OCT59_026456 [Rhizophagus irregularis]
MSLKDFFMKLVNKEISSECNIAVTSSKEIKRIELSEALAASATTATPASQNGFAILMQNARKSKLYLLTFPQSGNRKQTLRNDFVDWIHNNGGGWSTQSIANTQGKEFIMLMANFDWLRGAFDNFIVAISNYTGYLQCHHNVTAVNYASESPIRSIDQATTIKVHKCNIWVTPIDKTKYYRLEQLLSNLPPWKPVDIEEYLPNDPVQRMRYIQGLPHAFSFKIGEY